MGFLARENALKLIVELRPIVEAIRDADLCSQIRRAASSVALNLDEGAWRTGRDRTNRFRIAAGSAAETRAALHVAVAWGYVTQDQVASALAVLDRELALLWGLTHPKADDD